MPLNGPPGTQPRNRLPSRREVLSATAASLCSLPTMSASPLMKKLSYQHLFDLNIELHPILDLGATPAGQRRIVPVSGGRFSGARLRGQVHPHAGSDLLLTRADGSFQQDVRLVLSTDDSALILMTYRGIRHSSSEVARRIQRGEPVAPSDYYLRIAPFFETSASRYDWLNRIVTVASGERQPSGVRYEVFEIF